MFFKDSVGNVIEIISKPIAGSRFDYLWKARLVNKGPGQGIPFSFDSGDIGSEYTLVRVEFELVVA